MILITGGTGFLGRYLVREFLSQGKPVRILARHVGHPALAEFAGRVEVAEGDIMDTPSLERAMTGVEAVVHSAAVVSFYKKQYPLMRQVNVEGTANVVNVCLETGVQRLVYISSVSALGRPEAPNMITEQNKFQPGGSFYGRTKYLGEREVHRGVAEGLGVVMVNPTMILGAGDWTSGTPMFFSRIYNGIKFCPAGTNGFVAAEDVACAIALVLDGSFTQGERFILVGGQLSYADLFAKIAVALDRPAPAIRLSPTVARVAGALAERWAILTGGKPFLTAQAADTSGRHYLYDGGLFLKNFDFSYRDIDAVIVDITKQFLGEQK